MMPLPYLPPAAADFPVNYVLDKAHVPYMQQFYLAMKKDGQNPHQFAKWRLMLEAYEWWNAKSLNEANERRRAEREAEEAEAEALKSNA